MPTIEQAQTWYVKVDPVHGFDHVLRVYHLAERIGQQVGADLEILRAAALLHDVSDSAPDTQQARAHHERSSADFARTVLEAEGWEDARIEAVRHCIETHRYRGELRPQTLEAKVLFDADKLDVVGAFGAARTIGYAIQAEQPIYAPPSEQFVKTGKVESGECHSAYHEFLFKLRNVPERLFTEPAKQIAVQRHHVLCQFFEQMEAEASGMR